MELRQSAGNLQIFAVCINKLINLLTAYLNNIFNKSKILRDYRYEFICFFNNNNKILLEEEYKDKILDINTKITQDDFDIESDYEIDEIGSNGFLNEDDETIIKEILNNKKKYSDLELGHYLAGLIEGDGCIIVPKEVRSKKGNLNYPSIQISFNEKDLDLAYKIKLVLNTGYVSLKKNKKQAVRAYIYTVNTYSGILKMVELLNGKLRTNKIKRFWLLIDWLHNLNPSDYKSINGNLLTNLNIEKKDKDISSLLTNSWLSGFLEADSNFYISHRILPNGTTNQVSIYMRISQAKINHWGDDNKEIMDMIGTSLNRIVKLSSRKKTRIVNKKTIQYKYYEYHVRTDCLASNIILEEYLDNYPLFGSKYLDYIDWKIALQLFKPRFKSTPKNIQILLLAKSRMNDSRRILNWKHLANFYTGK